MIVLLGAAAYAAETVNYTYDWNPVTRNPVTVHEFPFTEHSRRRAMTSVTGSSSNNGRPKGKGTRQSLLAVIPMALSLLVPDSAIAQQEPYSIVNHYTGMVVDVWQGQTANTHTVLWPDWGGANQRFDLVRVDSNNPQSDFLIRARHVAKCLDVNNASGADGAIVQTFACHGGPSQRWFVVMVNDPYVQCRPMTFCDNARMTIRARHSGKCLDAGNPGPSLQNRPKQGAILQQWTCLNNLNQFWDFKGGPAPVVR